MNICITKPGHHWFRKWFVTCSVPSHYLNQCWLLVFEHLKTNLSKILIQIQIFLIENKIVKMSTAKWQPFYPSLSLIAGMSFDILMVSCQKGPTHHAYAWQIGPLWQDTLDIYTGLSGDYTSCQFIGWSVGIVGMSGVVLFIPKLQQTL